MDEALLEGHLGVTRELLLFQTAQKKFAIGSQKDGPNLIKVTIQNTCLSSCSLHKALLNILMHFTRL